MSGSWSIRPCSQAEALALAEPLGISETTARVLLRRGYSDPGETERFLAAGDPGHDPFALGAMEAACERLRAAIATKERICVHGDYDADGICATALAVLVLRELGADVDWHLPSRFDEGYGVSGDTLTRLAERGCRLVLTVDCGITAVEEVARARALGLDVIVTDHHRPGDSLPDCPIVATRPSDYPFPELCGTGVVWKLGQALLGADSEALRRHLDLVAVATISDVVPLLDENRFLAAQGLKALARTQKPGLRALMRSAGVDPAAVDEGAIGFRLAPRINAAGRLSHPEAALELLLTDDERTAAGLAGRLEELNRERQAVEDRILRDAVEQVESWPEEKRSRRGYVVAGEAWHEGVIGIVASRLVERFHRPVVLIAGTDREWKGSGRSLTTFDLHGALTACSEHLTRFGGHRAAAGLSIDPARIDAFSDDFAAWADERLGDADLRPPTPVDAVVAGSELTLELCGELGRLAPFGLGNPAVTLLLASSEALRGRDDRRRQAPALPSPASKPAGRQRDRVRPRPAGRPGAARSPVRRRLPARREPLERHGGPQLVVSDLVETPERYESLRAWLVDEFRKDETERSHEAQAVFIELGIAAGGPLRQLLESEGFRALLAEDGELAEAA